ncbi:T9SS type A sorting domain-containing protein [Croceimicrobium hydrocarbonivorans]|uniref:T9SS type A sorting domain-containing protein n=1 Tax=Croceimicrobium hydrocarbonivorans TaxID=2761580 RepID=A0A7H0VFU9_9FLAO|nr:T9SS type A sorting domain-containing protein [Croceimicrobium hydrocarbonivorans]QNR24597.1 T9SS type A sorting domain-containing protein [Croceimicrobium hydrocarbonivorans]
MDSESGDSIALNSLPLLFPSTASYSLEPIFFSKEDKLLYLEQKAWEIGSPDLYAFAVFDMDQEQILWQSSNQLRPFADSFEENGQLLQWFWKAGASAFDSLYCISLNTGKTIRQIELNSLLNMDQIGHPYIQILNAETYMDTTYCTFLVLDSLTEDRYYYHILANSDDLNQISQFKFRFSAESSANIYVAHAEGRSDWLVQDRIIKVYSPTEALRKLDVFDASLTRIGAIEFKSEYFLNPSGDTLLPGIEVAHSENHFLLSKSTIYRSDIDHKLYEGFEINLYNNHLVLHYRAKIAASSYGNKSFLNPILAEDGTVYFTCARSSSPGYYSVNQIDRNGNHPWLKLDDSPCDIPSAQTVYLYPNPTEGSFKLGGFESVDCNYQLDLVDFSGRIIEHNLKRAATGAFQLGSELHGMYTIIIRFGDGRQISKNLFLN